MAEVKMPQKKLQETKSSKPVVDSSRLVATKKGLGEKFKEAFLTVDGKDFKSYIIWDVLVPGMKHMALDTMSMMFFKKHIDGNLFNTVKTHYDRYRDQNTAYSAMYKGGRSGGSQYRTGGYVRHGMDVDYRYIVLRERDDAMNVVDEMRDIIRRNGEVSVAEFLDLVNLPGEPVDNNWGWKDERDLGVKSVSSGWLIDVREAVYLG